MSLDTEEYEKNLCLNTIKDLAQSCINILIDGIDNTKNVIYYIQNKFYRKYSKYKFNL